MVDKHEPLNEPFQLSLQQSESNLNINKYMLHKLKCQGKSKEIAIKGIYLILVIKRIITRGIVYLCGLLCQFLH